MFEWNLERFIVTNKPIVEVLRSALFFRGRQCCSVESSARNHPSHIVHLWLREEMSLDEICPGLTELSTIKVIIKIKVIDKKIYLHIYLLRLSKMQPPQMVTFLRDD